MVFTGSLNGWHVSGIEVVRPVLSGNSEAEMRLGFARPLYPTLVTWSHSPPLAQVNETLGIDRVLVLEVADGPLIKNKESSAPSTPIGI